MVAFEPWPHWRAFTFLVALFAATKEQEVETVQFCGLFHHADRYNGKAVRVAATYAVGGTELGKSRW
jgi:hypothetical protein